jgi:hypothetical protein
MVYYFTRSFPFVDWQTFDVNIAKQQPWLWRGKEYDRVNGILD